MFMQIAEENIDRSPHSAEDLGAKSWGELVQLLAERDKERVRRRAALARFVDKQSRSRPDRHPMEAERDYCRRLAAWEETVGIGAAEMDYSDFVLEGFGAIHDEMIKRPLDNFEALSAFAAATKIDREDLWELRPGKPVAARDLDFHDRQLRALVDGVLAMTGKEAGPKQGRNATEAVFAAIGEGVAECIREMEAAEPEDGPERSRDAMNELSALSMGALNLRAHSLRAAMLQLAFLLSMVETPEFLKDKQKRKAAMSAAYSILGAMQDASGETLPETVAEYLMPQHLNPHIARSQAEREQIDSRLEVSPGPLN